MLMCADSTLPLNITEYHDWEDWNIKANYVLFIVQKAIPLFCSILWIRKGGFYEAAAPHITSFLRLVFDFLGHALFMAFWHGRVWAQGPECHVHTTVLRPETFFWFWVTFVHTSCIRNPKVHTIVWLENKKLQDLRRKSWFQILEKLQTVANLLVLLSFFLPLYHAAASILQV